MGCYSVLILCQSYHDDYVYPDGRVVVSDGDGMAFSTQVSAIRCMWVLVAMYCWVMYLILPLPKNLAPLVHIRCRKPPGVAPGSPGMS
jgi:hypothetical protein